MQTHLYGLFYGLFSGILMLAVYNQTAIFALHIFYQRKLVRLSQFSVTATLLRVCIAGAIAFLFGCGNLNDITKDWTVEKIYQEAKDEMNNGGFDKAAGYFEKLEARAIGTPLGQQAQIEKAYAQYKGGLKAEAMVTLDRFMRLHPASPLYDYALYLRGLVNFNGDLGFLSSFTGQQLDDRDQKASKEAYASFQQLVTRFPDSKYSEHPGWIRTSCSSLLRQTRSTFGCSQPSASCHCRVSQYDCDGRCPDCFDSSLRCLG
jgi:tetratricopeptide (TPR) repeat protein